jgi:hypothetical protein
MKKIRMSGNENLCWKLFVLADAIVSLGTYSKNVPIVIFVYETFVCAKYGKLKMTINKLAHGITTGIIATTSDFDFIRPHSFRNPPAPTSSKSNQEPFMAVIATEKINALSGIM